jgi:hypothetical protein
MGSKWRRGANNAANAMFTQHNCFDALRELLMAKLPTPAGCMEQVSGVRHLVADLWVVSFSRVPNAGQAAFFGVG